MTEEMQAPIARKDFQEWAGATYRLYENIRQTDGSVLGCTRHDLLPEVHALFVGDPENLHATMDLCGLYDEKLGEFRFINKQLAAIVDGLAGQELWDRSTLGPNLLQLVTSYAKNAIEQGYKTYPYARRYEEQERTVRTGLNAMTAYAGVLAARGEENAVLELRKLALDMRRFWQDPLYEIYEKAGARMERQYAEKFDLAVTAGRESSQPPVFSAEKARSILRGLSVHAEEEAVGNGNLYAVWQCSRLAKQLWDEYPSVKTVFCGNFIVDTSERYTKFGSTDSEHLMTVSLLGQEVLAFSDPVPEAAVPEGWHCCHLIGADIMNVDKLVKHLPTQDYVGTVLSPCSLLPNGQQSRQIEWHYWPAYGDVSLSDYCERNHLMEPDMSGVFQEHQEKTMEMGGM